MYEKMIEILQASKRSLVFPEGEDYRILSAADRLNRDGLLVPILLGCKAKISEMAEANGINLQGIELIDPENYDGFEEMVSMMLDLRRGKMTEEECRAALKRSNYFGTMLVKMGKADGLLGGATYSTADTVRPALQLIKTKPGCKIVSSSFILKRDADCGCEKYVMADCAINLCPSKEEIVEITLETARTARLFGVEPRVALLSFSTLGSGKGESADKMRGATQSLQAMELDFAVDGELQFDAAFAPEVGRLKAPDSNVAGQANTFIFPDINAGNIGYKIAQRMGGFEALGPILQGLNAPINDLSRGCTADEVYSMAIITAASAQ